MTSGQRLRAAREAAGISAKELDRLAGITEGHSSTIEKSETGNAESKTLDRVAAVLGLSLDYLIRGDGKPPSALEIQKALAVARYRYEHDHEPARRSQGGKR